MWQRAQAALQPPAPCASATTTPAPCTCAAATPARCACAPTKAHRPWCALLVPRRPVNGGMFELGALQAAVMRRRGSRSDPVSEDDIVRAIKKLKVGRAHTFSRAPATAAAGCPPCTAHQAVANVACQAPCISPPLCYLGCVCGELTRAPATAAAAAGCSAWSVTHSRLQVLGGGIDVMSIGLRTYIRSVPGEFNMDKNRVMELAQQTGYISAGVCMCTGSSLAAAGGAHQHLGMLSRSVELGGSLRQGTSAQVVLVP